MIDYGVHVDVREIEQRLGMLSSQAEKVMARASNRAATTAKTVARKETTRRYFVEKAEFDRSMKVIRATWKYPFARVISRAYRKNLIEYKVSPDEPVELDDNKHRTPEAYYASVLQSGGGYLAAEERRPFVAVMSNGYKGVFRRKAKGSDGNHKRRTKNTPIEGVYGPSVPDLIAYHGTMEKVHEAAEKTMEKRLEHEISRVLDG